MKSTAINNSNSLIQKIKDDLSRIFVMLTSTDEEPGNNFASLANSEEDAKTVNELENSNKKLAADAQKYVESIGVPSKPKKQVQDNIKKQEKSIFSTPIKDEAVIDDKGFER